MSQKTDNVIKLGLVFFVCLLSFSIGTYVGKKYSDNQHKLSLLEPKNKKAAPEHDGETGKEEKVAEHGTEHSSNTDKDGAHTEMAAHNEHENQDELLAGHDKKPAALTDSEVAKLAEEFASDEPMSESKDVGTIDSQEKEVKTISGALKKAEKAVANHHQTPVKEGSREIASIPPKSTTHQMQYTVQIGSFPTEGEARKLTKDMQERGYKINFLPANVNGQTWYRVHVGLFGTAKEAQEYKREFLEKEKETIRNAIIQGVAQ